MDCLINQGISKRNTLRVLVKAIENQTRDNILTPEQAIEILLDGVIYEEELHQQTTLDPNACHSNSAKALENYITNTAYRYIRNSSSIGKNIICTSVYLYGQVLLKQMYIILYRIPVNSQNSFMEFIKANIYGKNINYLFTLKDCETIFC